MTLQKQHYAIPNQSTGKFQWFEVIKNVVLLEDNSFIFKKLTVLTVVKQSSRESGFFFYRQMTKYWMNRQKKGGITTNPDASMETKKGH